MAIYLKVVGEVGIKPIILSPPGNQAVSPPPLLSLSDMIFLILGTTLTLVITIIVGFIVGTTANDIRSSQLAANYASLILAFPLFLVAFGVSPELMSFGLKLLVLLDPYVVLVMLVSALITNDAVMILLTFTFLTVQLVFLIIIARVLLDPERILLGQSVFRGRNLLAKILPSRSNIKSSGAGEDQPRL